MVTNLAYFYESSKKVRGGKFVWVKDSNGEQRGNVLLGGTIKNPSKGFGYLWAAQLMQYTPGDGIIIFRSYKLNANAAGNATTIYIDADGYSDVPEVGQYLMVAPDSLTVVTSTANTSTGAVTTTEVDYVGAYAKVTGVTYDSTNSRFAVTLQNKLSSSQINKGTILVEADAAADVALGGNATGSCTVLCPNPNIFNEADREMMPTDGYGITDANYSASGVYNKQAWIARMQPLPNYVLAKNRSYIDGIFWI